MIFRVTALTGNAVVSGIFFGGTSAPAAATATLSRTDSVTQGAWKGVYGLDGSVIAGDATTSRAMPR